VIRTFGVAFGTIGGTSFRGADLTRANFSHADLKRTNFNSTKQRQTVLEWVNWQGAKKLDRARVGNSVLVNPAVKDLLVTRNGAYKSYVDANLRATDLDGVNLEGADLTWADLSCATLRHANLKNANLAESLVLHTDFTKATLTGACLEAWNIDSKTVLDAVNCQYVYLLRNQQERRPSGGDFAPGEFTKLFQEVLSTVDLIFRNGVDWKAFVAAFKQVQVQNQDTPLEVQSIENKGDGVVVVRVNVPPETDKAKIHSEFNQQYDLSLKALEAKYQAELKAKEGEIALYREQSVNMWGVINSLANRPINVQAIAKAMNDSTDQSQSFSVGGDFNINATHSVVTLGDLSGTVTNTINQLPASPDPAHPGIKELLAELQAEIEAAPELSDDDKKDALEQVKVLAELGQKPDTPEKEGLGRRAIKLLKGTVASLPETTKIVESSFKLLPLIARLLGIPV
jgi:uncharacterized protein YjbI with pentapeptide repeats